MGEIIWFKELSSLCSFVLVWICHPQIVWHFEGPFVCMAWLCLGAGPPRLRVRWGWKDPTGVSPYMKYQANAIILTPWFEALNLNSFKMQKFFSFFNRSVQSIEIGEKLMGLEMYRWVGRIYADGIGLTRWCRVAQVFLHSILHWSLAVKKKNLNY